MITIETKDVAQDLTISELILLKCICEGDKELFEILITKLCIFGYDAPLSEIVALQEKLYIKIMNNTFEGLILREKGKKFKNNTVAVDFEEFWKQYHKITKLRPTDKAEALKFWKRLKKSEIELAMNNIEAYYNSCGKYTRKAKYYLEYRLFNDEFKVADKAMSISIMI